MKLRMLSTTILNVLCIAVLFSCAINCASERTENQFSARIDYLFWKAQQDQMYYANAVPGGTAPDNLFFNHPTVNVDQKFKSNSGVRASLGYAFCGDWDTRFVGTHFNNCSFGSVTIPDGILVTAVFPFVNFDQTLVGSTANSRWNLQFNTVDWEFGRYWDMCEAFTMRSHVGLKWAKIKQKQLVNYPSFAGDTLSAVIPKCNTFNAVGPRCGLNADWCFWNNFSLIGNIAASLLYGKFNVNTVANITQSDTLITTAFPLCLKRLRPALEMLVGIDWKTDFSCFCDRKISFNIGVGYEAQYWWNQWQALTNVLQGIISLTNNGDLMLHGLTVRIGIAF